MSALKQDPGFLRWMEENAARKRDAQRNGWFRNWSGWPFCAVCYEEALTARGLTRATALEAQFHHDTEPERRIKDGDKCDKCGAIFPANSIPWSDQ